MTMMIFYRRRASPKHYNDMTEVEIYGGGTAHGQTINLCVYGVPPSPVYKGVEEGEGAGLLGVPQGESYSHRE